MRVAFLGNFSQHSSETHHALSLESLGHTVTRIQEGKATGEQFLDEALASDLAVVVHTHSWSTPGLPLDKVLLCLKGAGIPTVTYHLDLWLGLERQRDLDNDPFYRTINHFFTADKLMADWFNSNTKVRGHYLPAGVYDRECYISDQPSPHSNDVVFVGSRRYHPEWPWRPRLIDWLRNTYGPRFTHVGGDGVTGTVRGDDLNRLYANSKVAVGDSLCKGFNYPNYWSDRATECMGRGGFLIHPFIEGMSDYYQDGEHLRYFEFGDFDSLKGLIDFYLESPADRDRIRTRGHEHVKANHTYLNRWQEILDVVFA